LLPDGECLASGNNYSKCDLSTILSQYATHTDFVSHVDKLMSNDLSLLHCSIRYSYKKYRQALKSHISMIKTTRYYSAVGTQKHFQNQALK